MRSILALAIFVVALGASAQQSKVIPVVVNHSGDDPLGVSLAYELKEAIRASHEFKLIDQWKDPHIEVSVVTLDLNPRVPGTLMSYSYVIAFNSITIPLNGLFITSGVGNCGSSKIRDCVAQNIVPVIDQQVVFLRDKWPAFYAELK